MVVPSERPVDERVALDETQDVEQDPTQDDVQTDLVALDDHHSPIPSSMNRNVSSRAMMWNVIQLTTAKPPR